MTPRIFKQDGPPLAGCDMHPAPAVCTCYAYLVTMREVDDMIERRIEQEPAFAEELRRRIRRNAEREGK